MPSRATAAVDGLEGVPAGLGAWIRSTRTAPASLRNRRSPRPRSVWRRRSGRRRPQTVGVATGGIAQDSADAIVVANPGRQAAQVTLHVLRAGADATPVRVVRLAPAGEPYSMSRRWASTDRRDRRRDATQPVAAARQSIGRAGVDRELRHPRTCRRQVDRDDARAHRRGDRARRDRRRRSSGAGSPTGPPVDSFPTPRQLRRDDFPAPTHRGSSHSSARRRAARVLTSRRRSPRSIRRRSRSPRSRTRTSVTSTIGTDLRSPDGGRRRPRRRREGRVRRSDLGDRHLGRGGRAPRARRAPEPGELVAQAVSRGGGRTRRRRRLR